jgi:glutamate dehydrogenase (NAD(P)+)
VQGFGNVGSFLAKFLAEEGATVIAVSDSQSGLHNPNGIDVAAAIAHKQETGSLAGLKGAEEITNDELLVLECDVLAPCALEQVITTDNADQVKAQIVCEGANGPITPAADEILDEKGILVLPDILANAGGVVVSYFEWVQGLQEYFWKEPEVNSKLRDIVTRAFNETWHVREKRDEHADGRVRARRRSVSEARSTRGLYPTESRLPRDGAPLRAGLARCARCARAGSSWRRSRSTATRARGAVPELIPSSRSTGAGFTYFVTGRSACAGLAQSAP